MSGGEKKGRKENEDEKEKQDKRGRRIKEKEENEMKADAMAEHRGLKVYAIDVYCALCRVLVWYLFHLYNSLITLLYYCLFNFQFKGL